jgi:polar amino acid transport system substrate-binding protein
MRKFLKTGMAAAAALATVVLMTPATASADLLSDAKAGGVVRLGFANEIPWAYPGENNEPLGFVNSIVINTLKSMGITNIESVVTDWGGLIPGIKAKRYDLITGGMYILKSRCENMDFSEPIGVFGDAFVVLKGNPKGIHNYQDIIKSGAVLVTGTGYNIVEAARKEGVADENLMQVPGPTEMAAALLSGRADAIGNNTFGGGVIVSQSNGKAELTDPNDMPAYTKNWVGIGFRGGDSSFREAYNIAQAKYIGTKAMLDGVEEYGYTKTELPDGTPTSFACANR